MSADSDIQPDGVCSAINLTPITNTIWECQKLERYRDSNGEKSWRCLFFPPQPNGEPDPGFKGEHATKALIHVCKIKGGSVRACKGDIPKIYSDWYHDFYKRCIRAKEQRQVRKRTAMESITDDQALVFAKRTPPAPSTPLKKSNLTPPTLSKMMGTPRTSLHARQGRHTATASPAFARQNNHGYTYSTGKDYEASHSFDPLSPKRLDIAWAAFTHGNLYPFSSGECALVIV